MQGERTSPGMPSCHPTSATGKRRRRLEETQRRLGTRWNHLRRKGGGHPEERRPLPPCPPHPHQGGKTNWPALTPETLLGMPPPHCRSCRRESWLLVKCPPNPCPPPPRLSSWTKAASFWWKGVTGGLSKNQILHPPRKPKMSCHRCWQSSWASFHCRRRQATARRANSSKTPPDIWQGSGPQQQI